MNDLTGGVKQRSGAAAKDNFANGWAQGFPAGVTVDRVVMLRDSLRERLAARCGG